MGWRGLGRCGCRSSRVYSPPPIVGCVARLRCRKRWEQDDCWANRRLRLFAVAQVAASFVLLVGAAMLIRTLFLLQAAEPGFETRHVLAVDLPVIGNGRTRDQIRLFYREVQRRVSAVPSVERVSVGSSTPWRDAKDFNLAFTFSVEGRQAQNGDEDPRAKLRSVSPGYFASPGRPDSIGTRLLRLRPRWRRAGCDHQSKHR